MSYSITFTAPAACGCLVEWTATQLPAEGSQVRSRSVARPNPCPTHEEEA